MKKFALAAGIAALVAATTLTACVEDGSDRQVVVLVPNLIPAKGKPGDPTYVPARTIYPDEPGYKPSYSGMPPGWKPPASVTVLSPSPTTTKPLWATSTTPSTRTTVPGLPKTTITR